MRFPLWHPVGCGLRHNASMRRPTLRFGVAAYLFAMLLTLWLSPVYAASSPTSVTLTLASMNETAVTKAMPPAVTTTAKAPLLHWCLDNFPFFHEFNGRKTPQGPSVEFMQLLAERAGFRLDISRQTPVQRCFKMMQEGEADLMVNLNYTPERAEFMHLLPYTENLVESLYMHATDQRSISQPSQLSALRMATIRGYSYNPAVMTVLAAAPDQHIVVDSIQAGFDLLMRQRIDALLAPTQSSLELIAISPVLHQQFKRVAIPLDLGEPRFVHVGVSKRSAHLAYLSDISAAITSLQQDGTITRLYSDSLTSHAKKYLFQPAAPSNAEPSTKRSVETTSASN